MDLVNEIFNKSEELSQSIKLLRKNGEDLAEREKNYKIKLSQTALKLKDDGMPVTLINQVIYGMSEVADLRFKRDCADALYKANLEHIQVVKLQLRLMEAQVNREYGYKGDI